MGTLAEARAHVGRVREMVEEFFRQVGAEVSRFL